MNKVTRILSLVLCILLLPLPASRSEVVTAGILLTGMVPEADGSWRETSPEGTFRVFSNGREIGRIEAGRTMLALDNTDRIRLEPVADTFAPEWDLSTAYLTPDVSGSGTVLIPVTLYARGTEQAEALPATGEGAAEQAPAETAVPEATPAPAPAAPALTLPPFTGGETASPEPVLPGVPEGQGTGSLRVFVFNDKNENGNQGAGEKGVSGIPVYLLDEAETALAQAETDADGTAVFTGLPAGSYKIRIHLPDDWYFSRFGGTGSLTENAFSLIPEGSQTSGAVTVSEGTEAQLGAGIHGKAASLSGFTWFEETVDGLYTEGEPMLPGVRILLRSRTDDSLVYETESDAEGKWKISHIRPGGYVMSTESDPNLMLARYTQSRGKRSYLTTANSRRWVDINGEVNTNVNIGFSWSAQVYGRCYLDANYNGVYDEGELPLKGLRVTAKFSYDDAEAATAVSGEDGTYILGPMRGNSYSIQALLPSGGYVFTKTEPGEALGNRFAARGDQRSTTIRDFTLADTQRVQMDIGAIIPGTVKGTVYFDDNFSAAQDGKEKTVSGFKVTILDAEGNPAATDKSNARGVYELTGLTPGEYTLQVEAVNGYAFTKTGAGNVILNRNAGNGYSLPFWVELGAQVTGMDIGMIRPGTVKGTVFADRNDNGVRDADEYGLAGTTVRLMHETEGEAFSAEIAADGSFLFDAVMPGTYYVEYILPETGVFGRVAPGGNQIEGEGRSGRTASFAFATGSLVEAPLCGALTLGRIEGTAYRDHDGNGMMENEEPAEGLALRLIPEREDLEEITAVTGADGSFLLDRLRPGNYRLEAVCPEGFVLSRTDYMTLPLKAGKQSQEISMEIRMGDEWNGQKAGIVMPAVIRGQLWLDENNNGLFDEGERTPEGYAVTVTDEYTGQVFDTPVTDGEGIFSAAGMIPGSFTVSLPLDEKTLAPKAGDSVFREENGKIMLSGIRVNENETRDGLLMGIVRYTSIRGRAWMDRGGEIENLAGLQVTMKAPDGSEIARTTTAADGTYRLDRLMPCTYRLEVEAPEGHVLIEPGDARLDGSLQSAAEWTNNRIGGTAEAVLRMDEDRENVDFGCVLPGRLGDYCWVDLNGDGLQAGGEPGLANVRIELQRGGVTVAETVTNEYGYYRFVDLYPAEYVLKVNAPAEVKPTRRRTDLPMIASVLEETEDSVAYSVPVAVESNRDRYDTDLGFVCRKEGVLPEGAGTGAAQEWTPKY